MMRTWSAVYGTPTVSLRYFNVYGSHMDPEGPYAAVVGRFLKLKAEGKSLPITGDGSNTRDFVHVSDVARANILAATTQTVTKGEACNIGAGVGTTINDVARMIGGEVTHVEPRLEVNHATADITRAQKLLGYKPTISFEEGLTELL